MKIETFSQTPFVITGIKRVHRSTKSGVSLVTENYTGDMYEMRKIKTLTTLVDSRPYKKVYNEVLEKARNLNTPATKVWYYILRNLEQDQNIIKVPIKDCLLFCGYKATSRSTYYNAINELVENDFIAYSTDTFKYWINTDFFYNGNRMKGYKEDINFENEEK